MGMEAWARDQALVSYRAWMEWVFQQADWPQLLEDMDTVDRALDEGEPWPEAIVAAEWLLSAAVRYERVGA